MQAIATGVIAEIIRPCYRGSAPVKARDVLPRLKNRERLGYCGRCTPLKAINEGSRGGLGGSDETPSGLAGSLVASIY